MIDTELFQRLHAWMGGLNKLIGDTEEEIEKRRESNAGSVEVRADIEALLEYLHCNTLPPRVERAILQCLRWNPFSRYPGAPS